MGLFDMGKKSASPQAGVSQDSKALPVDQVAMMKQQGLTDNQIIQSLQRDGYKSHQIFDAMNQAELTSGSARQVNDMPQQQQNQPDPTYPSFQGRGEASYPQQQPYPPQSFGQAYPQMPADMPAPEHDQTMDRVEEIVESVVEEKWAELTKGVNKIVEWKERTDAKLAELEMRIAELKQSFEELNRNILGRISDYDKNMTNVGTDLKAMEKVFQQILPTFTENINELSRIAKSIKGKGN